MHYHVFFDVTQTGYKNWWFPAAGFAMAVAIPLIISISRKFFAKPRKSRFSPLFGGAFCFIWSICTFGITFSDYWHLRTALQSGTYNKVEGIVTDFVPQAAGDHEPEMFTVNGHRFSYSASVAIAGFNQTRSHNGPIRAGQQVRLAVVGDEIARLEIADTAKS